MKYLLIDTMPEVNSRLCILDGPLKGAEEFVHLLMVGEPVLPQFPENAAFHMTGRQDRIGLGGLIGNTHSMLILHRSIRDLLLAHDQVHDLIECLPVNVLNHKKRVASADHFIINPLAPEDCLDLKKSSIVRDTNGDVIAVEDIVLKRTKLNPKRALFRPLEDPYLYIAREDWLFKIKTLGLKITNVFATEVDMSR